MPSHTIAALGNLWQARGTYWQTIRPRLCGAVLSLLLLCLPVVVLSWGFDVFDDLLMRIVVTILVAVVPVLELLSQPRPLRSRWDYIRVRGVHGACVANDGRRQIRVAGLGNKCCHVVDCRSVLSDCRVTDGTKMDAA